MTAAPAGGNGAVNLVAIKRCLPLSCPHYRRTSWCPAGWASRIRLAWPPCCCRPVSRRLQSNLIESCPLPQLYHIVPGPPAAFNNLNDGQVFITALKPKTITVREIYAMWASGQHASLWAAAGQCAVC